MADQLRVREQWGTKIGVVLATAGMAVGMGNFLRFPTQVVQNGGGAFMFPYIIALMLVGLPMVLIEWAMGRYGGQRGHGSAPGVFDVLWKRRSGKYVGAIALFAPLFANIYTTYVCSWCLAYSLMALAGKFAGISNLQGMSSLLKGFQGIEQNEFFSGIGYAYVIFLFTFACNIVIVSFGIVKGIEKFSKYAMSFLLILAVIMAVRVITLPTTNGRNIIDGLGFMWNPNFSVLSNPGVWLAATGQVFFSLGPGFGVILVYASYLKPKDDVVVPALATASINEVCEVILGGLIVIPASFIFFGGAAAMEAAQAGAFDIGFLTMPMVFNHLPLSSLTGFAWFLLLFLAALTGTISGYQIFLTFLQDEFGWSRRKALTAIAIFFFVICHVSVFGLKYGVVDEMDFWVGTVFLTGFCTIEALTYAIVLGRKKGWELITEGTKVKLPKFLSYIFAYITPAFLVIVFITWVYQSWDEIILRDVKGTELTIKIIVRSGMLLGMLGLWLMVNLAWRKNKSEQVSST